MKIRNLVVINLFIACGLVVADRTLSTEEINTVLTALTQTPAHTWLPTGTIQARHLEYYEAEKAAYESNETMYFDGLRFYWEITLNSAEEEADTSSESSPVDANLLDANKLRIFCWDGSNYTRYYKSSNSAVIESGGTQAPLGTYGAFGAGVVPWGYGTYALQRLSQCVCTASEVETAGQKLIYLQILDENSSLPLQMNFVLDANKNYAVVSCLIQDPQTSGIEQKYSQYVNVGNHWVPTVITIERFLKTSEGRKVMSYEDWRFSSVSSEVPASVDFTVQFKNGTLVEFQPSQNTKTLMYYTNDQCDISSLLDEQTAFDAQSAPALKNCATAAVQFIARHYSKPFTTSQMESLVSSQNGMTNLSELGGKLQEIGLHCAAVSTNIDTMKRMENTVILLHLPTSSHYVILDHIDDSSVWTIDLTNRKIYWRTPIQQFQQEWKAGTALIISDTPQNVSDNAVLAESLPAEAQQQIMGGDAAGYSCTEKIQDSQHLLCSKPVGSICGGRYYKYWDRYGCKEDPNGGTCVGQEMPGHDYTYCISDSDNFGACTVIGAWYHRYIRACK